VLKESNKVYRLSSDADSCDRFYRGYMVGTLARFLFTVVMLCARATAELS